MELILTGFIYIYFAPIFVDLIVEQIDPQNQMFIKATYINLYW